MKITRADLLPSDYDVLFTRDPAAFIDAVVVNLMWSKDTDNEADTIARQQYIFLQWLSFYESVIREAADKEHQHASTTNTQLLIDDAYKRGNLDGQIYALATLPIKKSVLSRYVDLVEVAKKLSNLKAKKAHHDNL